MRFFLSPLLQLWPKSPKKLLLWSRGCSRTSRILTAQACTYTYSEIPHFNGICSPMTVSRVQSASTELPRGETVNRI